MSFDKKMRELKDTCESVYIRNPTIKEIKNYILHINPTLKNCDINNIVSYSNTNIRKIQDILKLYPKNKYLIENIIFSNKYLIYDTKDIVALLFNNKIGMSQHTLMIDEQERTSLSLYIHENIIDQIPIGKLRDTIYIYENILNNLCYVDTLDGIIFQKQIWSLNEITSIIKNIINPYMLHILKEKRKVSEIKNESTFRFTKVLTKYSSEYNNYIFIQDICQKLQMNKSDIIFYFEYLQNKYSDIQNIYDILESYEIGKLYTDRMFRYIHTINNLWVVLNINLSTYVYIDCK